MCVDDLYPNSGHVDVSATQPSRLLRRRLGISSRQNSSNCCRQRYSDKNSRFIHSSFCLSDSGS